MWLTLPPADRLNELHLKASIQSARGDRPDRRSGGWAYLGRRAEQNARGLYVHRQYSHGRGLYRAASGAVDGVVYGTKPYVYNGNLIENFGCAFRMALWWNTMRKKGEELLTKLLDTDAERVELEKLRWFRIQSDQSQRALFYNTLFDENAASPHCLWSGVSRNGQRRKQHDQRTAAGLRRQ